LRLLLANGADINDTNSLTGATPLHYATKGGSSKVIQVLLDNGADVNRRDNKGSIPIINLLSVRNLDESALKNRFKLAETLIKHGADVKLVDQEGNSAYKIALNLGRPEWIEMMEKASARSNENKKR
jgi:ankyrin repeat protein